MKKHLHHFSRGLVIGFEILGVLAVTVFAAWILLIIRLSQGPMDVDFLSEKIEAAINRQPHDFDFELGKTVLQWGGAGRPFEFEIQNVQIFRADKTPVLSIDKIGVQVSKRYLVFGQFVPKVVKVYGPALRVIRAEDGKFTLNIADDADAPESETPADKRDVLRSLLSQMQEDKKLPLLGGLRQLYINDAALLYDDKVLNVLWKSKKMDIVFTKGDGGLLVDSIVNLQTDETHNAYVRSNFYYSWQTQKPNGVVYFANFLPSAVAQQSEKLAHIAEVDMPLKGSFSFEMNEEFKLGRTRFVVGGDAGTFNTFDLYDAPVPIKKFYVAGDFNPLEKTAKVERLAIDFDGPKLEATAMLVPRTDGEALEIKARLLDTPMEKLPMYWPPKLAKSARDWVTTHISAGTATEATLDTRLFAPMSDYRAITLEKVGGYIDFNGLKVDYYPPLTPVLNVSGRATYDDKSFSLDIAGGDLSDMKVGKTKINITGLDTQTDETHAMIDIDTPVQGPVKTAFGILDREPLGYIKKLGVKSADVEGEADIALRFKFPLYHGLLLDEVDVSAKAKLKDVLFADLVAGMALTGGPMDLSFAGDEMKVTGEARLAGTPVSFDWQKSFSEKKAVQSTLTADVNADPAMLGRFGFPAEVAFAGSLPLRLTHTQASDGTAVLSLSGDITPAAFDIPVVGYKKIAGEKGALKATLHFRNDVLQKASGIDVATDSAAVKGDIRFGDGYAIENASFSKLSLGDTDISLDMKKEKSGYHFTVKGNRLDVSPFFAEDQPQNSDEEAAKRAEPVVISMVVNRLVTGKNKALEKVKLYLRRNEWKRIEQFEVDGIAGGGKVVLRYMPTAQGPKLDFEAQNAGAALSALGMTNAVKGGALLVRGVANPKGGPRDMAGGVILTNFTLAEVPALAMLLNAMSLTGIVELLNGEGIAFKKARANFWWVDQGQPQTKTNVRQIRLKDGETAGASLGLTFEGSVDQWKNMLDLNGTIIPVSDLNKLLSVIPLVGDVLTGGGEGVFAATYTIRGPKDQPTVTVNPLSVLAPGILRKLFFEN